MISFLKSQASAEETLGKHTTKATIEIDPTLGEINGPLSYLVGFGVTTGEKRIFISTEINKKLLGDLNLLLAEVKKQQAAADKEESKLRKEYKDANSTCIKAKQSDDEKKKASEKLQIELIQSKDLKPKNLQTLQNKSHSAEKDAKKAESEYKVAVDKQNKTREAYYKLLSALMDSLEVVDRKRINTMQNIFNYYLGLEEKMSVSLDEGIEKMTKSFEKLDCQGDITNFINKTKSGAKRPPVETFEPVDIKIPKELTIPKYPVDISTRSLKFGSSSTTEKSQNSTSQSSIERQSSNKESIGETEQPEETIDFNSLTTVLKKVVSSYDYEPQAPEELKLASGQIINVLQIIDDGWWIGEVDGKKGYFPSNFVTDIEGSEKVETKEEIAPEHQPPETLTLLARCKALFPYEPQDSAELALKENDEIDVYQKNEDGWWYGEVVGSGNRGLFPSNYVE